ncbi:MAG TPA: hypothetical protein VGM06_23285 [Polyangiaceae bacterium]|jgi:hypothetical protein
MVRTTSSRHRPRGIAPIEAAIAFALTGSLLAVAVPAFVREVHSSRLVEPIDGVGRLGAAAVAYGHEHAKAASGPGGARSPVFPPSAPMNPSAPPRGRCEADPPEAWDGPTWVALGFRPVPAGTPHCFAFAFDSTAGASGATPSPSTFRAHAHGDLDGDGIPSTFEVTGRFVEGDPRGPVLDPGMFVDAETE